MSAAVQLSWDTMSTIHSVKPSKTYYAEVREEAAIYGIENVGIKELLAIIIGPKVDSELCQQLAQLGPNRLMSMESKELIKLGAAPSTAQRIEAVFMLTKKLHLVNKGQSINSPHDVMEALSFIANEEQEHLVVLMLDTKNNLKKTVVVTKGINNTSLAHPREVFKQAIRESAHAIIIGHNHPSGNCTPSQEDISMSKRIHDAGELVGIQLLDSVIVGAYGYCSLKEKGLL